LRASGDAATYTWQDGSTGPQYLVQQSGVYWVEVNNSCGTATDEIKITTHRKPKVDLGSDTSICTYHPLLLDASSSAGGITYQWENGSSFPYRKIAKTGSYAVSLTNSCGTVSDTLEVTASLEACDCKIFIPNVITPNFDGVNDQFTISYPCEFKHFQLQIFDRWGQQIFASEDPENCWDGSAKHNCPNGTYYYVISYQGKDSYLSQEERKLNTVKGVVTLIR
jgi:gliding motility-associated-like protein